MSKSHTSYQNILPRVIFSFATCFFITICYSQPQLDSLLGKLDPQKCFASIDKRASILQSKIIDKTQKTLRKLQNLEEKFYKRMLSSKDSLYAKATLIEIKAKYETFRNDINVPVIPSTSILYLPKLDTLNTVLRFLDQNGAAGKIKESLASTQSLNNKFNQAEVIKNFIRERKAQLKKQVENLGLAKQLKVFTKKVYYYDTQIKEYKELLKNSRKAEKKVLEILSKNKVFKEFMRKNSQLAFLFRLPGNLDDPTVQSSLVGLQTRTQVNQLIQDQLSSGGSGAQEQFRNNLQQAYSELQELKNKFSQFESSNSQDELPDFKPNNQKTKSFLQRLEFGTNIQVQKANTIFPTITDIAVSVGYKLNDKSIVGLGSSFKVGLGTGYRDIRISSQGLGIRSFLDYKIKGSFWLSGGFEMNYRSEIRQWEQLNNQSAWQQSGLIGLSKIVSLKTKFFKKTKLQLLYDFLASKNLPRNSPIQCRIGYSFN